MAWKSLRGHAANKDRIFVDRYFERADTM